MDQVKEHLDTPEGMRDLANKAKNAVDLLRDDPQNVKGKIGEIQEFADRAKSKSDAIDQSRENEGSRGTDKADERSDDD
ncbi:hypothetical protein [Chelatococcus asaccharovorans]|uniref:hypothetical protein n=1 Tax=Chelatococcus asaccharovorans TaxID=28210 RepID=UPI0011B493D0|nr:hypothetical protein [Chelatococcus asaccharovorans]MBS7704759.1 hypothetical protein [Chelatococcus asaccharovorans]